jgi:dolichol-phosphate mannosyltransferase
VTKVRADLKATIVIPVHNESPNLDRLFDELSQLQETLAHHSVVMHAIFLDNASTDDSWQRIANRMQTLNSAEAIRFSRNYGFQNSITYGLSLVKTGCCVVLQSDLQDPPALVPILVSHWLEGAQTVAGKAKSRAEGPLINSIRRSFYFILDAVTESGVNKGVQDFYLLDASVCQELVSAKPQRQLIRTYISENYRFDRLVSYDRGKRLNGKASLNLSDYYELAMDGFLLNGRRGIKVLTIASFTMAALSLVMGIVLAFSYLIGWRPALAGWMSLMVMFTLIFSSILVSAGITFEFLYRILRSQTGLSSISKTEYLCT